MIRTRDLVLFVLSLLVLVLAIVVTTLSTTKQTTPTLSTGTEDNTSYTAIAPPTSVLDRGAILNRLRELIARDTSLTDAFQNVEPTANEATSSDQTSTLIGSQPTYCLYPDDVLPRLGSWPLTGIQITTDGINRQLIVKDNNASTPVLMATGTAPQVTVEPATLITFPVLPTKLDQPACLPSEVVGVTNTGVMIFNAEIKQWLSVPANTLIGYARDGYPIYGSYEGEVDVCGGYDHPAGYRYTIGRDRPYLLGCFTATPQSFTLP